MPKVSVALASHNGEAHLAEQLRSIYSQTRPPDELVVCDDASTDGTPGILSELAPPATCETRVYRNARRLGHVANFAQAIDRCTGDIVALSDQDDVWHPDKLRRCTAALEARGSATLVVHSGEVVDGALAPTGAYHPWIRRDGILAAGGIAPFTEYPGFSLAFRRSAIELAGGRVPDALEELGLGHDGWVTLLAGSLGDSVLLAEPLVRYRQHGTNTAGDLARRAGRRRWRARLKHALAADLPSGELARAAEAASRYRSVLVQLEEPASALGPTASLGVRRAAEKYGRYATAMERRAAAHRLATRRDRGRRIARNALRGDYARRSAGGLGLRSLGRDWATLARAPSGHPTGRR